MNQRLYTNENDENYASRVVFYRAELSSISKNHSDGILTP